MKVAAYQAPLSAINSMDVIGLIREQVARCEAQGVEILCWPEAVLGGLADYASSPADIALEAGRLYELLAPLASDSVTTIQAGGDVMRRAPPALSAGRGELTLRMTSPRETFYGNVSRHGLLRPAGDSRPLTGLPYLTFAQNSASLPL